MTFGQLASAHGYWLIAIGCLLEGETVMVVAGFAARRGYLDPFAVVSVASAAAFLANQFCFWLGRRHGNAVIARFPSITRHAARLRQLIERHPGTATVMMRFMYGARVAGPILIGMTPMPPWRYALLNAASTVVWAVLVGGAGWLFGAAAEAFLGRFLHLEIWLVATAVLAFAAWRLVHSRLVSSAMQGAAAETSMTRERRAMASRLPGGEP